MATKHTKKKIFKSMALMMALIMVFSAVPFTSASAETVVGTLPSGDAPYAVAVNPVTNKIYAANSESGTVTVIDGATNTTVPVAVGSNPSAVAVNPVTNKIYVVNSYSDNVTVIDGATNTTATVAAGTLPSAVAVNTDTNKIYVTNPRSGTVTVIDGATNATSTVVVGTFPDAVAVNFVTNKIYVVNYKSNDVTVINANDNNKTTTVAAGSWPSSVAVNPVTNKIYVPNEGSDNVTVIDGATNATSTVAAGLWPSSVAVNPVTNKIYVANNVSGNVTVIDANKDPIITTTVTAGNNPRAIAVNPVTNRIYVTNYNSNNVTVIDGDDKIAATIPFADNPDAVAVNPVTNRIYVANSYSRYVTVVDGATYTTTTVTGAPTPKQVAVNSATNMIYVLNYNSDNVMVIDGANNTTAIVPAGKRPIDVAVNPVTNKIYVANCDSNDVTVIDGATNTTTTVPAGDSPCLVAVNPVTNKIYVTNEDSNDVTVIDGANNTTTPVSVGKAPGAVAVNPVTNKIYVANLDDGNVTVINGATNAMTTVPVGKVPIRIAVNPVINKIYVANLDDGNVTVIDGEKDELIATVATGTSPFAIAVNSVTNKIYVANRGSGNVAVIDGAKNTTSTVVAGDAPFAIEVNPVTNKIYVANYGSNDVTVIDGASNTFAPIAAGRCPRSVAVNSVTNKIYVANEKSDNVTVIEEQIIQPVAPFTYIEPLIGDVTVDSTPEFNFSVSSPTTPTTVQIWYQVDTQTGAWTKTLSTGIGSSAILKNIAQGTHILYAMATNEQASTYNSLGSPSTGNISAYSFTVAPPEDSFTVTYDGNGATSGSAPIDGISSYEEGKSVTVLGNTGSLAKTGCTFSGWNTAADGSGTSYAAGATFTMGIAPVTLYAQWTAISTGGSSGGRGSSSNKYTVTYNGNTNSSGVVPEAERYDANLTVKVKDNTGNLMKVGSTFIGWNTKADGTGTFYAPKSTFAIGSADVVLYAVWSRTISYNNGDWTSNGQNGYVVAYDKATGRVLPMSYYDEKSGGVVYRTRGVGEIQAKYNFISFGDINKRFWASDYIWFLASRNVINGMEDDIFQPESNVTRAEFIKILASMVDGLDINAYPSAGFSDVKSGQWYENYVNWAVACGIVEGDGNGLFGTNDELTREQMCCMIERFCKYLNYNLKNDSNTTGFEDEDSIGIWAKDAVNALKGAGYISGRPNNRFEPQGKATRAEAAMIAYRLLRAMQNNMESRGKIEWKS